MSCVTNLNVHQPHFFSWTNDSSSYAFDMTAWTDNLFRKKLTASYCSLKDMLLSKLKGFKLFFDSTFVALCGMQLTTSSQSNLKRRNISYQKDTYFITHTRMYSRSCQAINCEIRAWELKTLMETTERVISS